MKTVHWSMLNGSGMHRVAAAMARAETTLGVESILLDPFDKQQQGWENALDADIHLSHTHIPERIGKHSFKRSCTKPYRWVFPIHGTPELVFEASIKDAEQNGYGSGTSFAQHQIGMQTADAIFTYHARHQALYQLATDKSTIVDLIPMGIDVAFWQAGVSAGKYQGTPSFFNCDNAYPFKWALEILRAWPWIYQGLEEMACLHICYLPTAIQRFVDVMAARYGSLRGAIIGNWSYDHKNLRNIFRSIDYYLSPVRYGDHNRVCLEAAAAGAKVISHPGNVYADFWIPEGDQRVQAQALIAIGRGEVAPRADKVPVPTEQEMGEAAINVYERLLDRPRTNWAVGQEMAGALDPMIRDALLSSRGDVYVPPVKRTTLLEEPPAEPAMTMEVLGQLATLAVITGQVPSDPVPQEPVQ